MSLSGFVVFCLVYALAVATPGPGVAAVLARSIGHGSQGASGFIAGFAIGDLVWFTVAVTGLAAIAERAQPLFLVLKYAGAVYLIYLAYRLWTAPTRLPHEKPMQVSQTPARLFLGSLVLTLGNPKTMIFFIALLPSVVDLSTLSMTSYLQIALAIIVILPLVLGSYVLAASQARRFFRSTRAVRMLNRGSATAMAAAAAAVATQ
jgi:threonine/homoserine/homoserine lactone efflux protein